MSIELPEAKILADQMNKVLRGKCIKSYDLIPSEWSTHGGGPFYLSYLSICDTVNQSLDWYEIDFYTTQHYTPEDFGESSSSKLTYQWDFDDYINQNGETILVFEFYFQVHESGYYHGELTIRDDRYYSWTTSWSNYLYTGFSYIGGFEFKAQDILDT